MGAVAPQDGPASDGAGRVAPAGDGRLALKYLAPGMTGFVIFIVVPLVASLAISLFRWPLFGAPEFVGADNYTYMLASDPQFWRVLGNTVLFTVAYTTLNLVLAVAIAVWLQRLGSWAPFFRVLFFVPVVVPMVANALVWRLMLDDGGLVNSVLALVGIDGPSWLGDSTLAMVSLIAMSIWQGIGYNIVVLSAGLNNISPNVLEAALIDGATGWGRFAKVIFPMLSPSVFFCTIMTVIGAFKVFTQPYMLTNGGPGDATNTLVLYLYRQGFSFNDLGYASALAWVLFVFVMLITALQFVGQKRWVNYES
ncbi:sugar ABC transporter permease [Cellulomonas sp. ATA003]|uniref:carbohydrate ABC transporter permease n=1 Tax=Cellulomonas sp. ATA003 TaxID=3073064 RepID=UPI00287322F3|nr:sugar ABC transporter permease [Cellulomonas sp. ATA003]WNB86172.1 sugar ABC transporter permease [Cellulomonas sp. ATA003]